MKRRCDSPCLRGFSLIELLVVIAVIAILATVLIPIIGSVMSKGHAVKCSSNLRQIGNTVSLYKTEYNGHFPTWRTWTDGSGSWVWDNYHNFYNANGSSNGGILPGLAGYQRGGGMTAAEYDKSGSTHIFNCPANKSLTSSKGYAANQRVMVDVNAQRPGLGGLTMDDMPRPDLLIMIADNAIETVSARWFTEGTWNQHVGFERHGGSGAQVLFADLHVGSMQRDEVQERHLHPARQN